MTEIWHVRHDDIFCLLKISGLFIYILPYYFCLPSKCHLGITVGTEHVINCGPKWQFMPGLFPSHTDMAGDTVLISHSQHNIISWITMTWMKCFRLWAQETRVTKVGSSTNVVHAVKDEVEKIVRGTMYHWWNHESHMRSNVIIIIPLI